MGKVDGIIKVCEHGGESSLGKIWLRNPVMLSGIFTLTAHN